VSNPDGVGAKIVNFAPNNWVFWRLSSLAARSAAVDVGELHCVAIDDPPRDLRGLSYCFDLGSMTIGLAQLSAMLAVFTALHDGSASGEQSLVTKTQQCRAAADCSTSGTARVRAGGGVRYAEVMS